ncbi:MAG: carboxypeptidase-like regulatory domain-containing protein, partial [Fibrobacterota bacterium]|nr:carboxypeptidase-like regulatory domain-containing protein [Chitinispirillaceae bacterium]
MTDFIKSCIALTAAMVILSGCTKESNLSGGIDVGNPGKIAGVVKAANDKVVPRAMVILGYDMVLPKTLKATDTVIRNGLGFIFKLQYFDTIFTDDHGAFSFDSLYLGDYVVAVKAPGLAGVDYVSVFDGSAEASLAIELTKPSVVTIRPAVKGDTSFSVARIAGIPYQAKVDSSGIIRFDSLPSGIRTLILYGRDESRFVFDNVTIKPETNAELVVDASIPVVEWVF